MFYVYILQSLKDGRTYVGYSEDPERRLVEHNSGCNKSTKNRMPFKIIYLEKFLSQKEAKVRELYWKSGAGRRKMRDFFRIEF